VDGRAGRPTTYTQLYQRQAEACLTASDPVRALEELIKLKDAFEAIPVGFLDEKLRSRLDYFAPVARRCVRELSDLETKRRASDLATWLLSSPRNSPSGSKPTREGMIRGTVTKIVEARGYGFVRTDDGRDYFWHVNAALGGGSGDLPALGARLEFLPGRDAAGRLRALHWASPGAS
jgi:cold shock CspA family protein